MSNLKKFKDFVTESENEEKSYSDILNESLNEGKSLINLKAMVAASAEEIEDILIGLNVALESAAEADPKNEIKGTSEILKALHKGTDLIKALKEAAKKA